MVEAIEAHAARRELRDLEALTGDPATDAEMRELADEERRA